jgi:CheY-like chemotaxis protein
MKKVLIIEDDQIVANIYRNRFAVEGYSVEVANDGEPGFELAKSFQPDAIILDLMLPGLSGVELMRMIRVEPGFEKVPLIVFSNTYLSNMVQDAWKAGATKCLSKANCTPRQVIDLVQSLIGSSGLPASATAPAASSIPSARTMPVYSPPPPPRSEPMPQTDAAFEADLSKSFVASLPTTLVTLRAFMQGVIKAEHETARLGQIKELHRHIRTLTGNAGITGMLQIAQVSDALEALLKELQDKPANINASTLRTVASAIDFLGFLFKHATQPGRETPATRILVVDDEAISRRAITHALERAKLKSVNVEDPNAAFTMASEQYFDLIFLDVDMPGMNGFELCTKLRALPACKTIPIVFVTSLNDLESRASSMMSGGNDFIAKPFLFSELAVKALVYVLRGKLNPVKKMPA